MSHRDDARLIFRASQALFPGAPSALLANSCENPVPKATARSWRQGHRRAPLPVVRRIHRLLQERAAECNDLWRLLGIEIVRREGEPPHRRGFMEIRERDGPGSVPRDARWRSGRRRKDSVL
jgi:hypothetical protein